MTLSKQTPDIDPVQLRVPTDTICFIIEKAREFGTKAAASIANTPLIDDEDGAAVVLEDRPADPVQHEILSYISDLSDGAQVDLVALMWLGRDEGPDTWEEARRIADEEHNDHTAEYLCGTPLLSTYLEEGMAAVGLDCSP